MKFLLIDGQGHYRFMSSKNVSSAGASISPPLGLLYLGRALEDEGHSVEILQIFNEKNPEQQLQTSLQSTDVVGIGISSQFHKDALDISNKVKELDPSIKIIVGGPHCTFYPQQTLQDIPTADISLEGEGDYAIKEIAKALQGSKKLSEIHGIYYRQNNKIKKGKPCQIIKDLDAIPIPARHLVDKYDYGKINNIYISKPLLTSMITSRGCPYRCRFCSRLTLAYKTYRQRSAENVVQELCELDTKYKSVFVVDDNFLVDVKRAHRIMDELISTGTTINLLVMGARVDSASRELYTKMKKAGVTYVEFGLESGNQDVLDFYHKNISLQQIRTAVELSREMNFITTGNFIFGAPMETQEHIDQTIKFASSLPLDIVLFYPLMYTYGSELWNEAVTDGKIQDNGLYSICADKRSGLGQFTEEELERICIKAFKQFYLRPRYIVSQVFRSIRRKNFGVLRAGMNSL